MPKAMHIWRSLYLNSCLQYCDKETEKYRVLYGTSRQLNSYYKNYSNPYNNKTIDTGAFGCNWSLERETL